MIVATIADIALSAVGVIAPAFITTCVRVSRWASRLFRRLRAWIVDYNAATVSAVAWAPSTGLGVKAWLIRRSKGRSLTMILCSKDGVGTTEVCLGDLWAALTC